MNKKALQALKESIKKWEDIASGKGYDHAINNCKLCEEYNQNDLSSADCLSCPIAQDTRQKYCRGTPYVKFSWYFNSKYINPGPQRNVNGYPEALPLAKEELDYLKGLLPKGER